MNTEETETATCRLCKREIVKEGDTWIDPEAPATPEEGDDYIWRECCEEANTFTGEHKPKPRTAYEQVKAVYEDRGRVRAQALANRHLSNGGITPSDYISLVRWSEGRSELP